MKKVAVIGAGNVGAHIVSAGVIKNLPVEFHLVDQNHDFEMAQVLDLCDSMLFSHNTRVYGSNFSDEVVRDADIFVITAGAKQEPGETRIDLLVKNREILMGIKKSIGSIKESAVIIMVTNPVDLLTALAHQIFNLPTSQIFGSGTLLDTARLRWHLARRFDINLANVHGYVLGEHGDSEFVAWSTVSKNSEIKAGEREQIATTIKEEAYRIIEGKGATYFGIGAAVAEIIEAVISDSEKILPLSVMLNGQYGISGVALGVPAKIGEHGINDVEEINLDADEIKKLQASAETLHSYLTKK